jgi:DNA-binding MarR family transcriptional regulator
MSAWIEIGRDLDQLWVRLGRQFGPLTRAQRRFLNAVAEVDGIGISELAAHLDMSSAGATRMADALEALGYVVRVRPTGDARHVDIRITEVGRAVHEDSNRFYIERLCQMGEALSASEAQQLARLVHAWVHKETP